MRTYHHYLGLGATGMLAGATEGLAARSAQQTLVARGASAFVASARLGDARAVDADWDDPERYVESIRTALAGRPAVDLCVLWLHGDAEAALPGVFGLLAAAPCRVIHVLGSSAGDPRGRSARYRALADAHDTIAYHTVVLGHMNENNTRRWLTHGEISAGVLACEHDAADIVVGELA